MKRIILAGWLMLLLTVLGQAQFFNPPLIFSANVPYQGPGNIISGASAYYGIRAYNAATAGTKALNVCNVSDVACADLSTNAGGDLVITTIGGSSCSVIVCTVKTAYDQTGGTACGGAACDATQAVIANRPTLVVNCINGRPCLACARSSAQLLNNSTGTTIAQPLSMSAVAVRTGTVASAQHVFNVGVNGPLMGFNTANTAYIYAQTVLMTTANDSTWHRLEGLASGGSSSISVDNSTTSGAGGAQGASANIYICGSALLDGNFGEAALWSGDKSTSFSALDANQKAYYGL